MVSIDSTIFALEDPLGAPRKANREMIAEADGPLRLYLHLGHRDLVCALQESTDFPRVVNSSLASISQTIEKHCSNGESPQPSNIQTWSVSRQPQKVKEAEAFIYCVILIR
jgi:hypothetical protein